MRKPFQIAFAILLVTVAGWAAIVGWVEWHAMRPHGPLYKGKHLSYWLRGYTPPKADRPGEPTELEAKKAVHQIGTNAIPTLLQFLRAKDSTLTRWCFELA